jgi:hypothetical protein
MGDLLKDSGAEDKLDSGQGSVAAVSFYGKYSDTGPLTLTTYRDYDWDEEDIEFASKIFDFLGSPASIQEPPVGWVDIAAHMFADFDASGGMISYFKKENPSTSAAVIQGFVKYAGHWLELQEKGGDYKNEYGLDEVEKITKIIQKTFYYYESQNVLLPQVRSSLRQFSFVNFKISLSNKINEWLESTPAGPEIGELWVVKKAFNQQGAADYNFFRSVDSDTSKAPSFVGDDFSLSDQQLKQLKDLGFFDSKTFYIKYIPNNDQEQNDIRANENLEATDAAKFETSRWLSFGEDEKFQNFVRQAYWGIGKTLLRTHANVLSDNSVLGLSLENIKVRFNSDIESWVNKDNRDTGLVEGALDKGQIGYRFAQYVLNNIRANALVQFLKAYKDTSDALSDKEAQEAFKKAEEAAKNNEEITGKDTDSSELSKEDIKSKQKFLKQCLLMSRLKDMQDINLTDIASKTEGTIHETVPYKGRLYLIDEKDKNKDKSAIINKLLIPNISSIKPFVNITPAEHASLVPKIRLVKVYTEDGELKEHEFKFPKHTDSNRINNLFTTDFDRGSDFGVKEFSFSFDGSTFATAKNDITATLKLYFQSFNDFIKDHPMNDGHRYVDLLILPSKKDGTPSGEKIGSGKTSPLQFDPSYYRIRADVGWEADSAPAHIRPAIKKINKTFYLNMIDHEIDIRDDGSVEISVSYRAYIETALKGTTLDALASREARAALAQVREQYQTVLNSAACTLEQLTTIRAQFLQIEENLRRNAFQSIIARLVKYGLLKHVTVDSSAAESFRRTGFISSPAVFTGENVTSGDPAKEKSNPKDFTLKQNQFKDVTLSNSDSDLFINYFFLADLLYVILDCLYDPADESKKQNEAYIKGTENFKFLMSSFQYMDIFNNSTTESINIGNIPISVELFNEWFTENVIKPERTSYPVMYFVRDITKYLVTEILLESCFKNDLDKNLQFKTNNFLGRRKSDETRDPIGALLASQEENVMLNVTKHYKSGELPLEADNNGVSTSVKNLYNYITIYAEAPRGRTDKVGNKTDDELNGIMHYQLGRDRGILKKIKFSKSDMQYVREARFFRHGHDGLMQLSAVYKVSMEMVGNTLYYPGMEVFIDPVGLIGAGADFDPRKQTSIANKMGFGGYHLITGVKSSIGPGKFTTSIEAMFSYSGDGDPKSKIIGSKEEIAVDIIDTSKLNEKPQGPNSKKYCEAIEEKLYGQSAAIGYGYKNAYEPIDVRPNDAVVQETGKEVETSPTVLSPDEVIEKYFSNSPVSYNETTKVYTVTEFEGGNIKQTKYKIVNGTPQEI